MTAFCDTLQHSAQRRKEAQASISYVRRTCECSYMHEVHLFPCMYAIVHVRMNTYVFSFISSSKHA